MTARFVTCPTGVVWWGYGLGRKWGLSFQHVLEEGIVEVLASKLFHGRVYFSVWGFKLNCFISAFLKFYPLFLAPWKLCRTVSHMSSSQTSPSSAPVPQTVSYPDPYDTGPFGIVSKFSLTNRKDDMRISWQGVTRRQQNRYLFCIFPSLLFMADYVWVSSRSPQNTWFSLVSCPLEVGEFNIRT